ncbi:MAG: hypothetical protein U0794_18240 [Isosphaeraceae bacterium]
MRLADYQRLRQLGESSPAPRPETPLLASAIHRVRWHDPQSIRVESELILNLPISDSPLARGGSPWREREIQASLDGVSVPLRIADGGKTAEIRLEPSTRPGPPLSNRRLVIGRTLTARSLDQWLVASLEINPCSDARVEAEPLAGGGAPELPDARGSTLPIVNGSTKAVVYGPASRLDVRWNNPAGQPQPRVATTVEAQYLWDALPAGDRVRTRMTYRTPGGTSVIRFAVEPGTMLRGVELPGSAEARLEGSRENPVWVARLVPPLPDGSTITVDARRPLERSRRRRRALAHGGCPASSRRVSSVFRDRWASGDFPTGSAGSTASRPPMR